MKSASWFLQENVTDQQFTASILFIDKLLREGVVNVHNLHTWKGEKSHDTHIHFSEFNFTINIWSGIARYCLLATYLL